METGTNSRMSPGWQPSAPQIASSVEKRMARALPDEALDELQRIDDRVNERKRRSQPSRESLPLS
jgi:phage shock protein A